jgi:PAP_fibrillin
MIINKSDFLNTISGYNRGLLAKPLDQQAILSVITRFEEQNPTPNPVSSPDLEGDWRLLYTSSRGILGINQVPLLSLGAVYQCIRTQDQQVFNIAEVEGVPFLEGIISVAARFTPLSERRVSVQFERVIIGSQKLMGYHTPATYIEQLRSPTRLLAIDAKLQLRENSGWLDTTYLDSDLRIGRGNEGSVFVLTKT